MPGAAAPADKPVREARKGPIRVELRVAFKTELSKGFAAMRRRSGARSGKRFTRFNTFSGARRAVAIDETWIVGKGNIRNRHRWDGSKTARTRSRGPGGAGRSLIRCASQIKLELRVA